MSSRSSSLLSSAPADHDDDATHHEPTVDPTILLAERRASELFTNAVILRTIFEHSDNLTQCRLLRVSSEALSSLQGVMYSHVRLVDYESMRDRWPPYTRLAGYTEGVRTIDIRGQLPALVTHFTDVWRIFGLFPNASRVEWSYGYLERTCVDGEHRFRRHIIIEPTVGGEKDERGQPYIAHHHAHKTPRETIVGCPIHGYTNGLRWHEGSTCYATFPKGCIPPMQLFEDRMYAGRGVGLQFGRASIVATDDFISVMAWLPDSICERLLLDNSSMDNSGYMLKRVAVRFPLLSHLELGPIATSPGLQWDLDELRDTEWSSFTSLRTLDIVATTARISATSRKYSGTRKLESVRPDCAAFARVVGVRTSPYERGSPPNLESLKLVMRSFKSPSEAIVDVLENMSSISAFVRGVCNPTCRIEFSVEVVQQGKVKRLDKPFLRQAFWAALKAPDSTDPPGWSRIARGRKEGVSDLGSSGSELEDD